MAHYLLSAEAVFSSAHSLPGIDMCERFHGHNWRARLTVRIEDSELGDKGMGIDFRDLEQVVQHAVADFDHSYLNDLEPFREHAPTAERITRVIYERVLENLADRWPAIRIHEIEVWEMPEYRVSYRPD